MGEKLHIPCLTIAQMKFHCSIALCHCLSLVLTDQTSKFSGRRQIYKTIKRILFSFAHTRHCQLHVVEKLTMHIQMTQPRTSVFGGDGAHTCTIASRSLLSSFNLFAALDGIARAEKMEKCSNFFLFQFLIPEDDKFQWWTWGVHLI